jgi:cell division protein FtsZ
MESFVQDALKFKEKEQLFKQAACSSENIEEFGTPKIVVVGCGGGGNNTVNRLYNIGIAGADTIAINTDKIHLDITQADKKILIGKSITRGLGAGGFPEIGRRAAELARGTLEDVLKDANLVFVTAGMGGGTGTGVAPVVAQVAKDQGAIVIGMVTSPFKVERSRTFKAEEGLDELRKAADTVIVLDNNRLLDYVPNLPIDQAFSVMEQKDRIRQKKS